MTYYDNNLTEEFRNWMEATFKGIQLAQIKGTINQAYQDGMNRAYQDDDDMRNDVDTRADIERDLE